jgi:hypothetical protein
MEDVLLLLTFINFKKYILCKLFREIFYGLHEIGMYNRKNAFLQSRILTCVTL